MLPTIAVPCPYCGERVELMIDASNDLQHYVEDCPVCCRPMEIAVAFDAGGELLVSATRDSDG
ncbi:CPXCG motif-containing cysteine-rich protein [Lysobacter niabensis]|uniref:CPXCG motif-containing cysteine-rich protein n=1 Tax=Agrilutibacter niabensis TaxID=380628 RepID=UPI0036098F55